MFVFFFFFKQKTAYEMLRSLVGSEMCIRDRYQRRVRGNSCRLMQATGSKLDLAPSQNPLVIEAQLATPDRSPERWEWGLFECCYSGIAEGVCIYFLCASCNLGRAAEKVLDANCCVHAFPCVPLNPMGQLCWCGCLCHLRDRVAIAKRRGIRENCCMSCVLANCCSACSLAQVIHEAEVMSGYKAGLGGEWSKYEWDKHLDYGAGHRISSAQEYEITSRMYGSCSPVEGYDHHPCH
eukprot:TRINITY_DN11820_c0_g1_i2.p1 TRINITY_DN11820_c0_g1~~TRINITY_DN11820_c0_g1_i2.p1  ORF type:complete len:237 (+),score=43.66 TRINITY_DN11820_c0_g1_i2:103-813(+)